MPKIGEGFFRRRFQSIAFLIVIAGGAIVYAHALTTNPAGFYIDKISVSFAGYIVAAFAAICGGALYLSIGQVIVGRGPQEAVPVGQDFEREEPITRT
jgi:hypothetical protein